MLAATVAAILWIGWPVPNDVAVQPPPREAAQSLPSEVQQGNSPQSVPMHGPTHAAIRPLRAGARLDLNRATVEELQTLPGIGPVLAQRVVERRTARGPFKTVEDLGDVKGIGAKRLEQLRPLVKIKA
ncbi:MAG: ComEA family DNA-binding protein [Nitrospiraceae bacterium]